MAWHDNAFCFAIVREVNDVGHCYTIEFVDGGAEAEDFEAKRMKFLE